MGKTVLSRPGSDEGLRRILDAARDAFSTYGFEGASLRSISAEAGVLHTALLYHFPSKDRLWRAVMSEMMEDLEARIAVRTASGDGEDPSAVSRLILRDFVYFCAERPELHRIMTHEGRHDTPRLSWMIETYTGRLYAAVGELMDSVDRSIFPDPIHLYYAIIGLAASTFTLAPEYQRLSGRSPFDPKQVETTAALLEQLIFGSSKAPAGP
ncbi:MAG: TetR family transcriptional regulator [Alphaproteobacteria bacterium]|nr:TetR family transcriptional regulator [Alphaproteobacteria bacterium]